MKLLTQSMIVLAVALAAVGCQTKGPSPKASPEPSAEGAAAAPTPASDPHSGLSPTQQAAVAQAASGATPDASGTLDLGAVTVQVPDGWKFVAPSSPMRRAQFNVAGPGGDAETVVFFMGQGGAGTHQANIDRWVAQFKDSAGNPVKASPSTKTVSGFEITEVEVAGEYDGGMTAAGQPGQAKSQQRLKGAIVSTPKGPYYIKLIGPSDTVTKNGAAFDSMIASIQPSP